MFAFDVNVLGLLGHYWVLQLAIGFSVGFGVHIKTFIGML